MSGWSAPESQPMKDLERMVEKMRRGHARAFGPNTSVPLQQQPKGVDVVGTSFPPRDEPYDPDMTVAEALQAGLIAIIDSGKIGGDYKGPCNSQPPYKHEMPVVYGDVLCTREKGHQGVCAYVLRWDREQAARMDAQAKAQETLDWVRAGRPTGSSGTSKSGTPDVVQVGLDLKSAKIRAKGR